VDKIKLVRGRVPEPRPGDGTWSQRADRGEVSRSRQGLPQRRAQSKSWPVTLLAFGSSST